MITTLVRKSLPLAAFLLLASAVGPGCASA